MKILHRVWTDIRRGENIDLFITVIVALGLVVLNLFGVAPDTLIGPITLAVLGLLAISTIGNRYRVESLLERSRQSASNLFLREYPSEFKRDFESARDLWLIGVTLNRTVRSNYAVLEEKLRKGHSIRVLLVYPEGAPIEMAVSRNYAKVNRDAESRGADIRTNLQLFCSLKSVAPHKLEIRTIQNPLTFGAFGVDLESASGVLYLEHYPYRTASDSIPKFVLRASDGYWYEFFWKEIRALWEAGVTWTCESTMPE